MQDMPCIVCGVQHLQTAEEMSTDKRSSQTVIGRADLGLLHQGPEAPKNTEYRVQFVHNYYWK